MILVKIPNEAALEELREAYNLTGYSSFLQTIRTVIEKLMDDEPDCECELQFPISFLSKSYQLNPTVFARIVGKRMHCIVKAHWLRKEQQIILHAGYTDRPRSFFGKIIATLQDRRCRAVDIMKRDMPKSFREQPHCLQWRLAKKIGRLNLIDLGDSFRYAKVDKPENPKKKQTVKQYEVHAYVRKTFA